MATVEVYSAEKSAEVEGKTILSGEIVDGKLVLHRQNEETLEVDMYQSTQDWTSWLLSNHAMTGAISGFAAEFDPVSGKTFYLYGGSKRRPTIGYWDNDLKEFGPEAVLDAFDEGEDAIDFMDAHGVPAMCLDGDGYIYVMWSAHNTPIRFAKSLSPRDTSAGFTAVTEPTGLPATATYISIAYNETDDTIYGFCRAGAVHGYQNGDDYPCHEFGSLFKTSDGGDTFTDIGNGVIGLTGHPAQAADVYPTGGVRCYNGKVYLCWHIAYGDEHDGARGNIYVAYYDPVDGNMYTVDGTNLGTRIIWAEHPQVMAYELDDDSGIPYMWTNVPQFCVDEDGIIVSFNEYHEDETAVGVSTVYWDWDGSEWIYADSDARKGFPWTNNAIRRMENGMYELFAMAEAHSEDPLTIFDSILRYTAPHPPTEWTFDKVLIDRKDIGVAGIQSAVVPLHSDPSLKLLWQAGSSDRVTSQYELFALSNEGIDLGKQAKYLFLPGQVRRQELKSTVILLGSAEQGEGVADSGSHPNGPMLVTESGQVWQSVFGAWSYLNNQMKTDSVLTGAGALVITEANISDGIFTVEMKPNQTGSQSGTFRFRYIDTTNWLEVLFWVNAVDFTTHEVWLRKVDGGVYTVLDTATFDWNTTTFYTVKVVADGSDIEVFIDDVSMLTATLDGGDTAQYAEGTKVGFGCYNNATIRWYDLYVTNLDEDPPSGIAMETWNELDCSLAGINVREVAIALNLNFVDDAATAESTDGTLFYFRSDVVLNSPVGAAATWTAFVDRGVNQWSHPIWVPVIDGKIEWYADGVDISALNFFCVATRS